MRRGQDAAVFAFALALRALFLAQWAKTPYWLTAKVDDLVHHQWALEILRDGLVRKAAFYQSPLYPYLLAGLYRLVGVRPEVMLWLQAFGGALACVVAGRIAARLAGPRAGLIAGLACAVYRPAIYQTGFLLKETWAVLAMLVAALACQRAVETRGRREAFLCGLSLGVCALLRGNAVLLLPVAAALLIPPAAGARGRSGGLVLGFALAVAPATLHNWVASRDFVLVNATTGFSVFIGNNPEANGSTHYPLGISSSPLDEEREAAAAAERAEGRPLKPSEVSRYWLRRAAGYALAHPIDWLDLTARKLLLLLNWYELPDDYDLNFIERRAPTLLSWPLLGFRWLGTFGLLGAAWALRRGGEGRAVAALTAAYGVTVLLAFVTDRYRFPFAMMLLPLGAAFLSELLRSGALERLRAAAPALPLALLCQLPILSYGPRDEAQGWADLIHSRRALGQHAEALDAFVRASQAWDGPLSLDAYAGAFDSALALGNAEAAREVKAVALARLPGEARLRGLEVPAPRRKGR